MTEFLPIYYGIWHHQLTCSFPAQIYNNGNCYFRQRNAFLVLVNEKCFDESIYAKCDASLKHIWICFVCPLFDTPTFIVTRAGYSDRLHVLKLRFNEFTSRSTSFVKTRHYQLGHFASLSIRVNFHAHISFWMDHAWLKFNWE